MRSLFIVVILSITSAASGQAVSEILLYNVKVIEVESGRIREDRALWIRGDWIVEVGDYRNIKPKTRRAVEVDGQGKYLIPGLWDMHVHFEGADLVEDNKALMPVFIAYGITTVRDCASDLGEQVLAWRDDISQGRLTGPTIYTAGRKLEGKNSIWKGDLEIENEAELNQMLDLLGKYKVDFVKITENALGGELFLKSVQAAHARGYRVSGHVPLDVTIDELATAGYTSIEHAGYLLRLGCDESAIKNDLISGNITRAEAEARYTREFNQQLAVENYKKLAAKGVAVCPTLIGGKQLAFIKETDHSRDKALSYLTRRFVANYKWRIERMANDTEEQQKQRKERYELQLKQIPLFQQAGLKIIAGSDAAALNTYVYPAESLLQELEIFQEAGLTPLQILQSATLNGASYFGVWGKVASIAAGKKADLVLLDENPLTDVRSLRKVRSVIVRGKLFSRSDLDKLLADARNTKVRLDRERKGK